MLALAAWRRIADVAKAKTPRRRQATRTCEKHSTGLAPGVQSLIRLAITSSCPSFIVVPSVLYVSMIAKVQAAAAQCYSAEKNANTLSKGHNFACTYI